MDVDTVGLTAATEVEVAVLVVLKPNEKLGAAEVAVVVAAGVPNRPVLEVVGATDACVEGADAVERPNEKPPLGADVVGAVVETENKIKLYNFKILQLVLSDKI